MWKEPPYFKDILDPETPGVDKYIKLVSVPDYGDDTEVHHIVPVAYFEDVLGLKNCRMAGSPDMAKGNLVRLSKGRHVLAHFYLAKYAKKCIAVQMRNAFCLTYQTTDFSKVTEEEVRSRIDEINAEYRRLKTARKEHKDGAEIRRTDTCVSMNTWKDGHKVGVSAKWYPEGKLRELCSHELGLTIEQKRFSFPLTVKRDGSSGIEARGMGIHLELIQPTPEDTLLCASMKGASIMAGGPCHGYGFNDEFNITVTYGEGRNIHARGECTWEKTGKFLSLAKRNALVRGIRSVRAYASLMGMKLSEASEYMLSMLERSIPEAEPMPVPAVPAFPGAA